MFLRLFRKDPRRVAADTLYGHLVDAARRPEPFVAYGVPDTVEGRFEVLATHVFLALRRLKLEGSEGRRFAQEVFDAFFRNIDDQLREMGVGDLSVGKKIRKFAEAVYGRMGAYEDALSHHGDDALIAAVARNVLGGTGNQEERGGDLDRDADPGATRFAQYMRDADIYLKTQRFSEILEGRIEFPAYGASEFAQDERADRSGPVGGPA